MRCNPSYWLLGLLPIAMLSWVAVQFEHGSIEADLTLRAQDTLSRNGQDWAVPLFTGRDGVVTGRADDDASPARALSRVRNVWGVRIADSQIDLIERIDRYLWSATTRGDDRIVLAGFVPNEDARRDVLRLAKKAFPKTDIADNMRLARGAPDRAAWMSGAGFALGQLAQLKTGAVELNELALSVVGEATTPAAYRSVKNALSSKIPKGVNLANEQVTAPRVDPYTWAAEYDGRRVILSGFAPTERLRDDLSARAKSVFRNATIAGTVEIAEGAPEAWPKAAAITLDQLAALKSGRAEIRAREVIVTGEAADQATADAVRRALRSDVPRVFKLTERINAPKQPSTGPANGYVMAIGHGKNGVELTGNVPSEAARAALVDAVRARFPGRNVADKLKVVAGAPDGWQQCIVAGLAALPRLQSGNAVLTDTSLVVTGVTEDYGVAEVVPEDVKAAAGQTCQTSTDIKFTGTTRTDLKWAAIHERAGLITLEGEAPSAAARQFIVQGAQQIFPDESVSDRMTIVGGPAEPWSTLALKGLRQLAELRRGESRIAGPQLTVKGQVQAEDVAARVRSAVTSGLPSGTTGRADITVLTEVEREADECEVLMRTTTARGIIQFARASADITGDSNDTLRELAQIANACPGFNIEIEGHTDAEGTDERNARLSERRARSVADVLIDAGVDRRRLSTIGYGASRPIADNDTERGRARNRRIEFMVKAQ